MTEEKLCNMHGCIGLCVFRWTIYKRVRYKCRKCLGFERNFFGCAFHSSNSNWLSDLETHQKFNKKTTKTAHSITNKNLIFFTYQTFKIFGFWILQCYWPWTFCVFWEIRNHFTFRCWIAGVFGDFSDIEFWVWLGVFCDWSGWCRFRENIFDFWVFWWIWFW